MKKRKTLEDAIQEDPYLVALIKKGMKSEEKQQEIKKLHNDLMEVGVKSWTEYPGDIINNEHIISFRSTDYKGNYDVPYVIPAHWDPSTKVGDMIYLGNRENGTFATLTETCQWYYNEDDYMAQFKFIPIEFEHPLFTKNFTNINITQI